MKFLSIGVIVGIVMLSAIPVLAFYPSGRINVDLSYSNITISKKSYSPKVFGIISNHRNYPITVSGKILFCNIHKMVLNSASIYETVPAHGRVHFERYLENNSHRDAFQIIWQIKNYSKPTASNQSSVQKEQKQSIAAASTRASEKFVRVVGNGKHHSEQFVLRKGLYTAKINHNGEGHFAVKLLHTNGELFNLLVNEIGSLAAAKAVRIDEDGYYLMDVSADAEWTVSLEYQEQKEIEQEEASDQNQTIQVADSSSSTDAFVIKLKNGRTMKADSYWEAGDELKVSIYGGIMTIKKFDVQEIVSPVKNSPEKELHKAAFEDTVLEP
jgi:hypothetical protein